MHLSWFIAVVVISGLEAVPLMMSVTRKIKMFDDGDTYNATYLTSSANHIVAVDYHLARGEVYYSDTNSGQIFRIKLREHHPQEEPLVIAEVKVSDGLAVDWVHNNLYWTDIERVTVEVATLDGLYRKVLLNETHGLEKPRAIVVDPAKGILFWSDWGDNARVVSTGLDGKNMKTIVYSTNVHWPNGLTLDTSRSRIFIVDGFESTLSSFNYDGSDVKILFRSPDFLQQSFGLTYYANTLYWNSWRHRALYKISVSRLQRETILQTTGLQGILERMMGLKAVHSSLQSIPSIKDPCSTAQCSHHCLVSRQLTPTCICAFGFRLSTDGKTCIEEGYLLVSWRKTIRRFSIDGNDTEQLIDTTKAAISIGYHLKKNIVFWSDVLEQRIYRAPLDQLNNKTVVATPKTCDGLAVDWVHDVLYWTDTDRNTLEAAQLNGSKQIVLFDTGLDEPRDIAVDPFEGLLFWTDWGDTPKIEQSTLDGKERKVILDYDHIWPNGITLDIPFKQLYYVDGKIGTIYKTSYGGSDRKVVFMAPPTNPLHLFSITVLENTLYWTDWASRSFYRSPKDNIAVAEKRFHSDHILLNPNGIRAVHSSLQVPKENPCAKTSCQKLCLGTKYQTARCMEDGGEQVESESVQTANSTLDLVKTDVYNDSIIITMAKKLDVMVMVKCLGRIGCQDDVRCNNQPKPYVFDSNNTINITDLLPASYYNIVVVPSPFRGYESFNITTNITDPPENPKITSIDKQNNSVTIKWDPVDTCFPGFSSYNFKLFKTATQDKMTQEGRSNSTEVTFDNLEAEVSYTAHIYTTNPLHHSSVTFTVDKGITPECRNQNLLCDGKEDCTDASDEDVKQCAAIKDILVYKKSKSDVYLRVEVTNETVKQLEKFIVSYNIDHSLPEQIEREAEPCVLWPESYCFHVSSLEPFKVYDFKISAALKSGKVGNKFPISTITKEEASGPPENVRVIKHNATCLMYQWNHPNQSNGEIKSFIISIDETETFEEDKCCQPFPFITMPVTEEEILYETATCDLTAASSYAISISPKTMYVGTSATILVNTPPPPMEVIRMPQVEVSSHLPLSWHPQDEQGEVSQYHDLIRSYMLLLLPPKSEPLPNTATRVNVDITELLQSHFGHRYFVLWDNKVEDLDAFKRPIKVDSLTARKQYKLAWVQVAQYKDSFSIDYLESDPFIAV